MRRGHRFTGLICPEQRFTPLKANILLLHLNLSWIFRSTRRLGISQVTPSGGGQDGKGKEQKADKSRREGCGFVSIACFLCLWLFAGAGFPPLPPPSNQPPAPPPSPARAELSPGGLLSASRRQGVRRSCNWNTNYMNNEPETTAMTRNRDQGTEMITNRQFCLLQVFISARRRQKP